MMIIMMPRQMTKYAGFSSFQWARPNFLDFRDDDDACVTNCHYFHHILTSSQYFIFRITITMMMIINKIVVAMIQIIVALVIIRRKRIMCVTFHFLCRKALSFIQFYLHIRAVAIFGRFSLPLFCNCLSLDSINKSPQDPAKVSICIGIYLGDWKCFNSIGLSRITFVRLCCSYF